MNLEQFGRIKTKLEGLSEEARAREQESIDKARSYDQVTKDKLTSNAVIGHVHFTQGLDGAYKVFCEENKIPHQPLKHGELNW